MTTSAQLQTQAANLFPLADLTPKIRAAVLEGIDITQAPPALVASSGLAAASLAVQTKFNVKRLDNLISPCALYFIAFAESGERKTTADRIFFDSFREFEQTTESPFKNMKNTDITNETNTQGDENVSEAIRLIYADTTTAAFLAGLHNNSNSAALCEDEAGRIFNSRIIDDLGLLSKLWNGSDIYVDRKYGSFKVRDPRCTISWMVQPAIFKKYMERKGDDARGIGFLARCLVCYPQSTQGTRFLRGQPKQHNEIEKFRNHITKLLNDQKNLFLKHQQESNNGKTELSFSPEAQVEWETIFNNIEYAILPGGVFCEARDYAAKVAENIARLAGIFHAFEGYEGTQISIETLRSAARVVLWYASEFVRLFSPPSPAEVINGYARLLDEWLIQYTKSSGQLVINKNHLLQLGPNQLRSRDMLNIAIQRLMETNRIGCAPVHLGMNGRISQKATQILQLNAGYYGQLSRGLQPFGWWQPL